MAKRPRNNNVEHKMARNLDALAQYEDYANSVMPILRRAVQEKWPAAKIMSEPTIQAMLAARAITNALFEKDTGRSQGATSDVLNRVLGKATERREVKHQMESADDASLDALIKSRMASLSEDDEHTN